MMEFYAPNISSTGKTDGTAREDANSGREDADRGC
jgi:hypothetical protein